jgi:uncharacterized protein YndB with AHSA1/START domain
MAREFIISTLLSATPDDIYDAWLSSDGHSSMTGSYATVSAEVGGEFDAWDGYIHGRNLELVPGKRIVQSWRTSEFKANEPDSRIEIILESVGDQTRLSLHHTDLPPHGGQYEQGWVDAYFKPMIEYFTSRRTGRKASLK